LAESQPKEAGADLSVLLRGNAVNYVVNQACPTLAIGSAASTILQTDEDISKLHEKGVPSMRFKRIWRSVESIGETA